MAGGEPTQDRGVCLIVVREGAVLGIEHYRRGMTPIAVVDDAPPEQVLRRLARAAAEALKTPLIPRF